MTGGGLKSEFRFATVRLWEHAERIRNGELRELAPLLVLCEDQPTERVLEEERELILGMEGTEELRNELLGMAVAVGQRFFSREVLERLFREEWNMLKEMEFVQEWMSESREEGREEGREETARRLAHEVLTRRFGPLPTALGDQIQAASASRCEELILRALSVETLDDLELPQVPRHG